MKCLKRASELIAPGPVLGVVDHEKFAAGERQRVVQRLRLGAGTEIGHDDYLDIAGKIERFRRRHGRLVHRLQDQFDIQLGGRPVEPRQRLNERGQHVRLAIERHENGVGGKRRIRNAGIARRLKARVSAQS